MNYAAAALRDVLKPEIKKSVIVLIYIHLLFGLLVVQPPFTLSGIVDKRYFDFGSRIVGSSPALHTKVQVV